MSALKTYDEALDFLYSKLPMFTRIGAAAYKKDLTNTLALCAALGNPQDKFKSIHIAGTNGKGSVSHMLAAVLQKSGYKTGLYTSPHLLHFGERIRINGEMIPEQDVVDFVNAIREKIEEIEPSFFEVTVAMAFHHFARNKVDIAVIETGLGGRLDSTNIITPLLSIITNISFDHQNLLGESLEEIAGEKAGIIKPRVPVVIGKRQVESEQIFIKKAVESNSEIAFAEDSYSVLNSSYIDGLLEGDFIQNSVKRKVHIRSPLAGNYQLENFATVLTAVEKLRKSGLNISENDAIAGIKEVKSLTGFAGRWEVISQAPLTICDVAHNEAGLKAVFQQVNSLSFHQLHIVYGMVKDKDIPKALSRLPRNAKYYFSAPDLPRALDSSSLTMAATEAGLEGKDCGTVANACQEAANDASANDLVLVTGSIFVVAEALAHYKGLKTNA